MVNNGCYAAEMAKRRRGQMISLNVGGSGGGVQFFERSLSTRSSRSVNTLALTERSILVTSPGSNNNVATRHFAVDKPLPIVHFGPVASL